MLLTSCTCTSMFHTNSITTIQKFPHPSCTYTLEGFALGQTQCSKPSAPSAQSCSRAPPQWPEGKLVTLCLLAANGIQTATLLLASRVRFGLSTATPSGGGDIWSLMETLMLNIWLWRLWNTFMFWCKAGDADSECCEDWRGFKNLSTISNKKQRPTSHWM